MFTIRRYTPDQQNEWNSFVATSKQGTFLFDRGYMDYHQDRYRDHSLMIFQNNKLFALLPANVANETLYSHQGLTYGGLLTDRKSTTANICKVFSIINDYLRTVGIQRVVYKPMPWIYHQLPADEDLYALTHVCHAQLSERHLSSCLSMDHALTFTESRKCGIRKAIRAGLTVEESSDIATFWKILNNNLHNRYHVAPVHNADELQLLKTRFPNAIRLFLVLKKEEPIGGTLVFETPQVIHTQYIASTPDGKSNGALDLLFDVLIHKTYSSAHYFDFGRSSLADDGQLNRALIFQKEGFGGRGVCYDCYEWKP